MQNSQILQLPRALLKKTNIWTGVPGGAVNVNEMGESLHVAPRDPHPSEVVMDELFSVVPEHYHEGSFECPTCEQMGKHLEEVPYDPSFPMLSGTF